jgi:imidazolonepropionase-like amidohydrolase/ABC-type multidrug transport system permease subunit
MNSYLALIRMNLRLTMRDRAVVFFNYLFPLIFFFIFAQSLHANQGAMIVQVVDMVLTIGVLGAGLFGAGMRAVMEREANILRRFKVAPITSTPILVASMVVAVIHFTPLVVLVLWLAHAFYGMPVPQHLISLILFLTIGLLSFRGIGLIISAVVNSMQEAQIVIQILYLPMLFLSGATFPTSIMPVWVQLVAQFLPATHFFTGTQSIMMGNESLAQNWSSVVALLLTSFVGTFIAAKLFRWEKEEKISSGAKTWVAVALAPFIVMGIYQSYTKDAVAKAKVLDRELSRDQSILFKDARIFIGDGTVIDSGAVLVRDGKIARIFTGSAPDAKSLKAEEVNAAGKTLMPGLIDVDVHLADPGGVYAKSSEYDLARTVKHDLSAYLYSGITAVRSVGDPLGALLKERAKLQSGEDLGADLYLCGPIFTAAHGYGTEILKLEEIRNLPEQARKAIAEQLLRMPATPDEARREVDELKNSGADGIEAALDAGTPGMLFERMDLSVLRALAAAAHARNLPITVHTGDRQDVADALSAEINGIDDGSARGPIPAAVFARMKAQGVDYDPALASIEGIEAFVAGKTGPLDRSLVEQVGPAGLIQGTKAFVKSPKSAKMRAMYAGSDISLQQAEQNLKAAYDAGVTLVAGSGAGNILTLHGPTIQRELQLWAAAGVPAKVALEAATYNAARLLGAGDHVGLIRTGYDATLLLVDGNPLEDIGAAERISVILFKGERISRTGLFENE